MPFASHVIRRGRKYQYVRRAPSDIADIYPFPRIQRSLTTYSEERFTFVQSAIRPLGVSLSRTAPYFGRFMAACLKAEIESAGYSCIRYRLLQQP